MSPTAIKRRAPPWIGSAVGPAVWAANMELGQILPYAECRANFPLLALISGLAALLSLAAGAASWLARDRPATEPRVPVFVATVSALAGLVLAFALLLQALSSLLLTGCER